MHLKNYEKNPVNLLSCASRRIALEFAITFALFHTTALCSKSLYYECAIPAGF